MQPRLTGEPFKILLHKVTSVPKLHHAVLFYLTADILPFHHLVQLLKHFEKTERRILALEEDCIQTDWAALNKIVDNLLGQNLVKYVDLGMKSLPPSCLYAVSDGSIIVV